MTPRLSSACSNQLSYRPAFSLTPWWRHGDSNPGHPACKAGALPTELYPQSAWDSFEERELFGVASFTFEKAVTRVALSSSNLGYTSFFRFKEETHFFPLGSSSLSPRRPKVLANFLLLRKEVIQPQVPLRLPCYDFIPVTSLTLGHCLLAVGFAYFGCDRLP